MASFWWFLTVLVQVLVFVGLNLPVSAAQTNALRLSIDCGSNASYTDKANITWSPDNDMSLGDRSSIVLPGAPAQYLKTLRYFPNSTQSKFCYELPATIGTTYLLRATFRYVGTLLAPTQFQLQVDTITVANIKPVSFTTSFDSVVEVTMSASAPQIHLCLAPVGSERSTPFINAIELRELDPVMYPKARQGYMMITSHRYNMGYNLDLRYPGDDYDRVWKKYPGATNGAKALTSGVYTVLSKPEHTRDKAPPAVLRTALSWPRDTLVTLPFNVSGGRNYVVLLWFAELEGNGTREFQVGVDDTWEVTPIDVTNVTGTIRSAYEWQYGSVALSSTSSISFRATENSTLGPILNAIEVYEVSDPVQPRTHEQDVAAINGMKELWPSLKTWTGDPCLALPYNWISCSVDTLPRITMLDLHEKSLTGSIPNTTLLHLPELTLLSLGNNSLHGSSIPDLSALQQLQDLHLQNNNISSPFPAWVTNLPNLKKLYLEGNNLTGYVPQSLFNTTRYNFTYTPTADLCTGPSPEECTTPLDTPLVSMAPLAPTPTSHSSAKLAIIIGSLVGVLALTILVGVLVCVWRYKRRLFHLTNSVSSRQLLKADPETAFASTKRSQTMAYSFKEVKEATNNFEIQIGEGSFGPIYKGTLSDGREVAVKRCRPCNIQGATDFFNEVEVLARIYHRNLAALVGFCKDSQEQILLYEYLSNSDLWTHLHGDSEKHLPWSTRLSIALDAALAIEYLHTGCVPSIVHRDVQPRNILLTRNVMRAKVVDFAFAKFTSEQDPQLQVYSIDVKGTAGYLDPEFAVSRHLSEKSDVYSFGVVLLELVSGQEPINKTVSDRSPFLVQWMRGLLAEGELQAVVDPRLDGQFKMDCIWRVAELGMACVEPRPHNRPTMAKVVDELREAVAFEDIPHPSLATPVDSLRSTPNYSGPL